MVLSLNHLLACILLLVDGIRNALALMWRHHSKGTMSSFSYIGHLNLASPFSETHPTDLQIQSYYNSYHRDILRYSQQVPREKTKK